MTSMPRKVPRRIPAAGAPSKFDFQGGLGPSLEKDLRLIPFQVVMPGLGDETNIFFRGSSCGSMDRTLTDKH